VSGPCKHGYDPSGSTKSESFVEQLSDCKLLKKNLLVRRVGKLWYAAVCGDFYETFVATPWIL
jgi:hypothetical protein